MRALLSSKAILEPGPTTLLGTMGTAESVPTPLHAVPNAERLTVVTGRTEGLNSILKAVKDLLHRGKAVSNPVVTVIHLPEAGGYHRREKQLWEQRP